MAFSTELSTAVELDEAIKNSILQNHRQLAFNSEKSPSSILGQEESGQTGSPVKGSYDESGPPTPISGPPPNFAKVATGIYRSSFPRSPNFEHLNSLGLKTIITLVPAPHPPDYAEFVESKGITHITIPIPAHKDDLTSIPAASMMTALNILLDASNYPILVHCNKGKHRTGCVIACYRKVHDWTYAEAVAEYRQHAGDKARPLDEKYIDSFDGRAYQAKQSTPELTSTENYLPTPPSSEKGTSTWDPAPQSENPGAIWTPLL